MKRRLCVGLPLLALAACAGAQTAPTQPTRPRRLAVLNAGPQTFRLTDLSQYFIELLRQGGHELGRNLVADARYAEGEIARLPALADELVAGQPDVIVAFGNEAVAAAQRATTRIPVVMGFCADPVSAGFVRSLARPGGNITGAAWVTAEIAGKTLAVLKEAVPRVRRVAALFAAADPALRPYREALGRAAAALGITLVPVALEQPADVLPALEGLAAALPHTLPDALYVTSGGVTETRISEIVEFAQRHKLPALGISPSLVRAGGLLYYGPDVREVIERTASFVSRILHGAAPADLPVEQPTRFKFIVNQKAARAMGLVLPQAVLLRADEVIE